MLKSDGQCLIDAIEIGEVDINLISNQFEGTQFPGIVVNVKYALVSTKTGARLGAGTRSVWNETTQTKLRELLEAMEQDIAVDVFSGTLTTDGSDQTVEHLPPVVPQL